MKILVDTCVWSLSLRRKKKIANPYVFELQELIREYKVQMIGSIRQEILSGIKSKKQFKELSRHLRAFPDLETSYLDYECAAEFFNIARGKGIQGSNTDFLMCAVSSRHNIPILTMDKDFQRFQKHLPITLHNPRELKINPHS